jgi:hypothetical protein
MQSRDGLVYTARVVISVKVAGLGFEPLQEMLRMRIIVDTLQTGRFFPPI